MRILNITMKHLNDDDAMEIFCCKGSNQCHEIEAKLMKEKSYDELVSKCNNEDVETCLPFTKMEMQIHKSLSKKKTTTMKSKGLSEAKSITLSDTHRQEICEWSFKLVDCFDGKRELVAIALNYLDRFLNNFNW